MLEQHYTCGGFSHSYERAGYEWDVGGHYIGDLNSRPTLPLRLMRRVFDVMSEEKLQWVSLGAQHDCIVVGDKAYDFLSGADEFKTELKRHFPGDSAAIDRFVELLDELEATVPKFFAHQLMPRRLGMIYAKMRRHFLPDYMFKTVQEVLEGITDNRELIHVLSAQWCFGGLTPRDEPFLVHGLVVAHYLRGCSSAVGGNGNIAATIIPTIEAAGGHVFSYAEVGQILIENDRAVGVRMKKDGVELRADQVVSAAGLLPTYTRLIPRDIAERHGLLENLSNVKPGRGHVCLFAGFNGSAAELGLPKINFYRVPPGDHLANQMAYESGETDEKPVIIFASQSAKDPTWDARYPNKSTMEVIFFPPAREFDKWKGTTWGKRGDDYEAMKERYTNELLEFLFGQFPQLRQALDFCELSTPLSTEWYTANTEGEMYGLQHDRARFDQSWIHSQTPIKGLYLAGADVVAAGLFAAMVSGIFAAIRTLGWRGYRVVSLLYKWKPKTGDGLAGKS